jgi:hypothetical protein
LDFSFFAYVRLGSGSKLQYRLIFSNRKERERKKKNIANNFNKNNIKENSALTHSSWLNLDYVLCMCKSMVSVSEQATHTENVKKFSIHQLKDEKLAFFCALREGILNSR